MNPNASFTCTHLPNPPHIPVLQVESWTAIPGLSHGFSTRKGGVSAGPWESLNLAAGTGDSHANIVSNLGGLRKASGLPNSRWLILNQVHGNRVVAILSLETAKGFLEKPADADGQTCDKDGIVLCVKTADCVPILLWSPQKRVFGAVHAGWKGTVSRIAEKATGTMEARHGVPPGQLEAAIGPGIGPCCFRVDQQVASRFPIECRELRDDGIYVDLWEANRLQLVNAGIPATSIATAGICTSCHPDHFFSHRRDNGKTGRMLAWIGRSGPT